MDNFWVVLGNLWETATGGVLMLATQPGADCISQGSLSNPTLLCCLVQIAERGGVVGG